MFVNIEVGKSKDDEFEYKKKIRRSRRRQQTTAPVTYMQEDDERVKIRFSPEKILNF